MKTNILAFIILCMTITSCDSTKTAVKASNSLNGTWKLNYISGPKIAFDGLYPDKKPTITFDSKENKILGNNSCNKYFGALIVEGNKINFKDAKIGMTMMACQGAGESTYMKALEKIDSYSVSEDGKTLNLITGDIPIMRFEKVVAKE